MAVFRTGWLRRFFGDRGEREAARYLRRRGYKILARQMRNQQGEIDLITMDGKTIVFVEVKTRKSHAKGHPSEAVDSRKQKQMTSAAMAWLKRRKLLNHRGRFDVIAITWGADSEPVLEHYENAFSAVGFGQMYS